jgi:cellulose biosynthesis protein BcsQ
MVTAALYNLKGGVGKTAGCVNFAYLAAEQGSKTIIWDLDPQGAATFYLQQEAKLKGGIKKILQTQQEITNHLQSTAYHNLSLLPADFGNRHLDALLEGGKPGKKKLKALLAQLEGLYDYLFIDCPPGLGNLSESLFAITDYVVMPAIPTTLSIRSYEMVLDFFRQQGLDDSIIKSYFNMVDVRKNLHNETLAAYRKNKHFLKNYIPYLSTIEKMGTHLAPVAYFAPASYAAHCFRNVWKELKRQMA